MLWIPALGSTIEAGGCSMLAKNQFLKQFVSFEQLGGLTLFLYLCLAEQITGMARRRLDNTISL